MNWINAKEKEMNRLKNIYTRYKKHIKKYLKKILNQWILIKENSKKVLFKMRTCFYTNHTIDP